MEFIVKLEDGSQQGPLDQETVRKWVEIDKIKGDTPVRNAMLPHWKTAKDFDFLHDALEAQATRAATQAKAKKGLLSKVFGGDPDKPESPKPKEVSSAFKYEYIPQPARVYIRLCAAAFDWLLIGAFALLLTVVGMCMAYLNAQANTAPGEPQAAAVASEEKAIPQVDKLSDSRPPNKTDNASKGLHLGTLWTDTDTGTVYACVSASKTEALWCEQEYLNSLFMKLFTVICVGTLLYLGFSLGFTGQTFGMWFWGIFIVKSSNGEAVYPLRAFAFACLSLPLGFLMPAVSFILPDKRAVHDMLTDIRLIGISAKPKS